MNGFATEIYVAPESQRRTPIDPSKAVSLSAEIRTPAVALAYKILVPEASFSFFTLREHGLAIPVDILMFAILN